MTTAPTPAAWPACDEDASAPIRNGLWRSLRALHLLPGATPKERNAAHSAASAYARILARHHAEARGALRACQIQGAAVVVDQRHLRDPPPAP